MWTFFEEKRKIMGKYRISEKKYVGSKGTKYHEKGV